MSTGPTTRPPPVAPSLLFVCMGNICRSPLAEGVFTHLAERRGIRHLFTVDSCGTGGWHAGELPDPRARHVASRHGIPLDHRARPFSPDDPSRFQLLLPMDRDNLRHLLACGCPAARTMLIRRFDPALDPTRPPPDVPDPYYGGNDGFDRVFEMLTAACSGLIDALLDPSHPALADLKLTP